MSAAGLGGAAVAPFRGERGEAAAPARRLGAGLCPAAAGVNIIIIWRLGSAVARFDKYRRYREIARRAVSNKYMRVCRRSLKRDSAGGVSFARKSNHAGSAMAKMCSNISPTALP